MAVARDNIMARALQYQDDGVEYSLMSLCKSPTRVAQEELAVNMNLIQALETALTDTIPDWKVFLNSPAAITLETLSQTCRITQNLVDNSKPPAAEVDKIEHAAGDPGKLMTLYGDWVRQQDRLRSAYLQEVGMVGLEDEQALQRKVDHTPLLYRAVQALAEAGVLGEIVEDIREQEEAMDMD